MPVRGIHLDLKGMPPTFDRLMQLLKVIRAGRYNLLLVEWEDMFPWTVDERFRGPSAYTPNQVRRFAEAAGELDLEIVPLVQCLGHLETVLDVEDYAPLREVAGASDVLNPLAEGASELIGRMIEDVVALLPNVRYFHLGGDEAWSFGTHPDTKAYIEKHGKASLYMHHIQPLLDQLNGGGIRPILWHDMMIEWEIEALRSLGRQADLMPWGYGPTPDETDRHYATRYIERFHEAGVPMWGGTAYKGADGVTADLPDLARRRHNAAGWMRVADRFGFKGMVATAWSRYNTHAPQCESIDASLDALLLVGAILHDGDAPLERRNACLEVLQSLGERERFQAVHEAARQLTTVRNGAWKDIQTQWEQVALRSLDPIRSRADFKSKLQKRMAHWSQQWSGPADQFATAMEGAVDDRWIEEYLAVRRNAIEAGFAALEE
jgi:hexosaminidase